MQGGETMGRKSNVCYDLTKSPYTITVDGVKYHFSSAYLMQKFVEKLDNSRKIISESLTNRFHFDIDARRIADLFLYTKTESRGFYIVLDDGEAVLCQENLRLSGGRVTAKISQNV